MIEQGLVLMVVGMGVVFCFLILLVITLQVMGSLLRDMDPPEPAAAPSAVSRDDSLIVAVAAARRHRGSSG